MAEHGWSILCDRAIVDADTNQVSLVDAADVLLIGNQEAQTEVEEALAQGRDGIKIAVRLALVSWWYRTDYDKPELAKARLRLLSPNGVAAIVQEFDIRLTESTGYRAVMRLALFPISGFGLYRFVIERSVAHPDAKEGWEQVASLPLDVKIRQPTGDTGEV